MITLLFACTLEAVSIRHRIACCLLAGFLLASALGADGPMASDPLFVAQLVDGKTVTGRIRQLDPAGGATLVEADGTDHVIPPGRLLSLTRQNDRSTLTPEMSVVIFPEGDRIHRASIGSASETALDVQSYSLGNLSIPLDSMLGLVMALPTDTPPDALEALVLRVREEARNSEVLWLLNGDRLSGGYLGLTDKVIEFQTGKEKVKVDRSGVAALGFEPSSVVYPRPKAGAMDLTLSDGSRLGVSGAKIEQGQVVATSRFGVSIKVPLADLSRVHARPSSIVYLTERDPSATRYVPYVGSPRPFRRDASVEGHAMRLSGREYDRGIGMESRTLLAYKLEPGDRRFQTLVGLDDRAGPQGNVVFRVLVDGKERFASPPMAVRDAPIAVDVDLSGAKNLILATEFGERGGVRDIADWVEARILRDEAR
jgi:hypothetical protein